MELLKKIMGPLTGVKVHSAKGEYLGRIIDVTKDSTESTIEYLILQCKALFGGKERFFAIPAFPTLINTNNDGEIILMASKDDLRFAKGVRLDQCPEPNIEFSQSIFELYEYTTPNDSH